MLENYQKLSESLFDDAIACIEHSKTAISKEIAQAAQIIVRQLNAGNKILVCGNGGSAADALHFSAELLNRFETERRPLPAIALNADVSTLTSISNDYDYSQVFCKQVQALGQPGDVLLSFSTSGNSKNVIKAIDSAAEKGMLNIALTGKDGGLIAQQFKQIGDTALLLNVPNPQTARIQEVHGIIIHCLCSVIDQEFTT